MTIGDLQDVWGRVWLTGQSDGRRILLLNKNDAPIQVPIQVLGAPADLCVGFFMWLFGIRI